MVERKDSLRKCCGESGVSYANISNFLVRHPELKGSSDEEIIAEYKHVNEVCARLGVSYVSFAVYKRRHADELSGLKTVEEQAEVYIKHLKWKEQCDNLCRKAGIKSASFFAYISKHKDKFEGRGAEEQVKLYLGIRMDMQSKDGRYGNSARDTLNLKLVCSNEGLPYNSVWNYVKNHAELRGHSYEEITAAYRHIHELCDELGIDYNTFVKYRGKYTDEFLDATTEEEQLEIYVKKVRWRKDCEALCKAAGIKSTAFFAYMNSCIEQFSSLTVEQQVEKYIEVRESHGCIISDEDKLQMRSICDKYGCDYATLRLYIYSHKDSRNCMESLGYKELAIRHCICNKLKMHRRFFDKILKESEADFAQETVNTLAKQHMEAVQISDKLMYCHCKHCEQDGVMTHRMVLEHLKNCYYTEDSQKEAINTLIGYLNSESIKTWGE